MLEVKNLCVNYGPIIAVNNLNLTVEAGQMVALNQLISNDKSPFYNLACTPTPADFEQEGDVPMPAFGENQWPLPGVPWKSKKA